jgi:hypothetical protein
VQLGGPLLFTDDHLAAIISTYEPEREKHRPRPALAYDAEQAAAIIGGTCKASWLKQQARDGIIPHLKLGGAYHFIDSHLSEILSIHEVGPKAQPVAQSAPAAPRPARTAAAPQVQETPVLKPRAPRDRRRRPADDPGIA